MTKRLKLYKRLREEIEAAKGEALRAFGSDTLLIEKYFTSVHHVEVLKLFTHLLSVLIKDIGSNFWRQVWKCISY